MYGRSTLGSWGHREALQTQWERRTLTETETEKKKGETENLHKVRLSETEERKSQRQMY